MFLICFLLQKTKRSLKITAIERYYQKIPFYYTLSLCLLFAFVNSMCPVSVITGWVCAYRTDLETDLEAKLV